MNELCLGCAVRLIPAHAGKTEPRSPERRGKPAHPRSRGENRWPRSAPMCSHGSSPLTRGKRVGGVMPAGIGGLIPAHAGKTPGFGTYLCCPEAHPRSRGENGERRDAARSIGGSSPLTRGKHGSPRRRLRDRRLIPAHAGKTSPHTSFLPHFRAHPRSRGENLVLGGDEHLGHGSSPLTRGKHFLTCVFIAQIGQILESLELCASSESYSSQDAYATDAPQDQVRSIGLVPRSSRDAS
ncbi:hypothetical protein HMPREF0970_01433 [Schaalia odontolytica F0309]|nr:hypothetical protein HMPREF0970_01433 [Schaalia odontolytica F0309]